MKRIDWVDFALMSAFRLLRIAITLGVLYDLYIFHSIPR